MQTNKLRETLNKVLNGIKHLSRIHNDDLPEDVRATLGRMAFDANESLAEPVRNYEVGTAEEQKMRFDLFCHGRKCEGCCLYLSMSCALSWAQMPYAEQEGGAK